MTGVVAGGTVRVPSMTVMPARGGAVAVASSRLWRRFWPVLETTRSRLAAGLKSTPKLVPLRATVSWPTLVARASPAPRV